MRPSKSESPPYGESDRSTGTIQTQAKPRRSDSAGEVDCHLDSENASGYGPDNTANLHHLLQLQNLDWDLFSYPLVPFVLSILTAESKIFRVVSALDRAFLLAVSRGVRADYLPTSHGMSTIRV